MQEAAIWRRGADGVKDGPTTPATQVIYDSTEELLKALKAAGPPYREVAGRDWFDFEAPTALGYDVRLTQRDVILVRDGSKVKLRKTFRGGFTNHFDPPTPVGVARQLRGWVGVDGTLAKKRFRFVTTHLEAYSPAIADQQMQQLLKGPLASKKRQSILVGDYNSAPGANANDRGTTRADNAYDSAIKAGFRNNAPAAQDVLLRRGPAQHGEPLETWIDHVLVRPKIKVLKSGDRRHQAGRRPLPVRPRGHHRHAAPEVRIVAGRWGGRRLTTPKGLATRPTSDRVREALFSILGDFVQDARVLDLFAGSGALGLEALSRGAAEATFVDSAAASVTAVKANLEALGGEAEVRRSDALRFLRRHQGMLVNTISSCLTRPTAWRSASGASCRRPCQRCWRPPRS